MSELKLKPCPFCKREAHTEQMITGRYKIVAPHKMNCVFQELLWRNGYETEEEAAEAWNKWKP